MKHKIWREDKITQPKKTVKRGFTLIEILVVMAIMAILASILFPVFARARENARRASCMSNMKQLALATLMYTQDYDGKIMPRDYNVNPFGRMMSYIDSTQILRCPSGPPTELSATSNYYPLYGFPSDGTANSHDRVICALVSVKGAYDPTPGSGKPRFSGPMGIDQLPNASKTCLFGETRYPSDNNYFNKGWGEYAFYASADITGYYGKYIERARHFDGSNYAYADGHVKWIKKAAVDHVYTLSYNNGGGSNYKRGITKAQASQLPIVFAWKCPGATSGGGWSNRCY